MEIKNKEVFFSHCNLVLSNMFGNNFLISEITDESDHINSVAFNCKFESIKNRIKGNIYYESGWSILIDGFLTSYRDEKLTLAFIKAFKQESEFLQNKINKYSGFVENIYSR
jgi:hypothetical protein